MTDERDMKRTMIVPPEGGDIPASDSDAPKLGAGDPKPITLESMAQYIRALTHGLSNLKEANAFPINEIRRELQLNDDKGKPAAINFGAGGSETIFDTANLLGTLGVIGETFDSALLERIKDPNVGLHRLLYEIKASAKGDATTRSFNTEGRATFDTPPGAGEVQQRVSDVLKHNRFHPGSGTPFVEANSSITSIDERPIGRAQTQLGKYITKEESSPGSGEITYEEMKKLGLALMLRASGEFIARQGDPTDAGVGLAALVPGESQIALTRIDANSMRVTRLSTEQGAAAGLSGKRGVDSDLIDDGNQQSYGNLTTFLEPFDGFAPLGMIALGAIMVVAVKLAMEGILAIFSLMGINIEDSTTPHPDIRPLGAYHTPDRGKIAGGLINLQDFGIKLVNHDYLTCVNRGVDVFFQFDGTDFIRVVKSPGYYVTLVRAVLRSGNTIVNSIADAVSQPNPIGAVQSLLGLVDVIKDSKIVGFLNVMAILGDNVLALEESGFVTPDATGTDAEPKYISKIDTLSLTPASRIMKSRENRSEPALAWRTASTPSMYLLPTSIKNASNIFGGGAKGRATSAVMSLSSDDDIDDTGSTRIDPAAVEDIENRLEAEYVPFYFHDLRTNELVSFHAFLSSCTDGFTVNHESSDGYGRVDPVMIYKNTKRAISLSFMVVSTSPRDFDVMWWKLNKLITLLYPQWSKGRRLTAGQNTFIQPFSQTLSSSPVIRLRLGDVIKSNYSKFALARLFGMGLPKEDFSLQGAVTEIKAKVDVEYKKIIERIKAEKTAPTKENGFAQNEQAILLMKPGTQIRISKKAGPGGALAAAAGAAAAAVGVSAPKAPAGDAPLKESTTRHKVKVDGKEIATANATGTGIAGSVKVTEVHYQVTLIDPPKGISVGPYVVNASDLDIDTDYVHTVALEKAGVTSSEEQTALDDFFSADKNIVVRAFESVRGRGLAGVITSMNFDWKTPTWETEIGSRAPQWCLVTMNFAPIHDIAPGIDADGFNRAPVYNVGNIVHSLGDDPHGTESFETAKKNYKQQHDDIPALLKPKG